MKTNGFESIEPDIKDLLNDPILLAVLKSDGIRVQDLKEVIASYHESINAKAN